MGSECPGLWLRRERWWGTRKVNMAILGGDGICLDDCGERSIWTCGVWAFELGGNGWIFIKCNVEVTIGINRICVRHISRNIQVTE